jgi:uncharacterized protein (TIGR00299 family) protein
MKKKILLFDPAHGAAGDMIIGAFLDAGVCEDTVLSAMEAVGKRPVFSRVNRAGISAVSVDTCSDDTSRTFAEVLSRVDASDAPPPVIAMAKRVFSRIARAEAIVHFHHYNNSVHAEGHGKHGPDQHGDGMQFLDVHFHEVGADDAIADVIGACMAIHLLSPDGVIVRPVAVGSGEVMMSHGLYPVPAPATVAIFQESSLTMRMSGSGELCTPTGAALLSEFLVSFPCETAPEGCCGKVRAVGYGAGKRDPPGVSNVLRLMVFDSDAALGRDGISDTPEAGIVDVLETNVDDVSGEVISFALSQLMQAGARDAVAIPILMKKGRPGYLVKVIARPEDSYNLSVYMAKLLGTLGVRCVPSVHRFIADREFREVELLVNGHIYLFPVKFGYIGGKCFTLKAEFDPAHACAQAEGVSVLDLLMQIESAARRMVDLS